MYENLNTGYAATTSTLRQETTITRYSRATMNCSNCKGRGRRACPSLYGPAPGARPPSDTIPQLTTPPRLARHKDERRSSCAANASESSAYYFTHISQGSLDNDNQSEHIRDLKLHSGVLTRRLLPELCGKRSTRHPVRGAPIAGTTPLQPQHSPLDVRGPVQKHSSVTRALYTT